jgi:secreted trypsin-like serine protease
VILTAAHCLLDDFDVPIHPNQFRVVLGGQYSDMTENKYDFNAQIFSVQKVIIHEGYVGERELHQNDIGILKLEGLVHITNTVSPVCLSANGKLAEDQLKIGSYGEVVGFGRYTNEIGSIVEPSPTLRQASLPVVHKDGCYDWQKYHLNDSQICAGYLNELSV